MRHLSTAAFLLTLAVSAACTLDSPIAPHASISGAGAVGLAASAAASCEAVAGAMEGNFAITDGLMLHGLGSATVSVVDIVAKGARGHGAIHSVTMHQISAVGGTITTTDEGVLAPIEPPVYRLNHRWTIAGGTGAYVGASGYLHPHALINLETGEIEGFFKGRICLP